MEQQPEYHVPPLPAVFEQPREPLRLPAMPSAAFTKWGAGTEGGSSAAHLCRHPKVGQLDQALFGGQDVGALRAETGAQQTQQFPSELSTARNQASLVDRMLMLTRRRGEGGKSAGQANKPFKDSTGNGHPVSE